MNLKQLNAYTDWLLKQGTDPNLEIEEWAYGGGDAHTFVNVEEILNALKVPEMPSGDSGLFGGY